MNHTETAGTILMRQARRHQTISGVFMSFWLRIPPTSKRREQIVHLALYWAGNEIVASLISPDYIPTIGELPPRNTSNFILPHATILYTRRRLERFGINRIERAVSEREVQHGKALLH